MGLFFFACQTFIIYIDDCMNVTNKGTEFVFTCMFLYIVLNTLINYCPNVQT